MLDCVGPGQLDGRAAPFVPPPRQQLLAAVHAFRFIDSQISFTPDHCRLLLRLLRADALADRKRWFSDVMACRRRPQGALQRLKGRGVGLVLSTEDEYHLLVQSATLWRIGREFKIKSLGIHDVFHAWNGRRGGMLSCGELAAGLQWLRLGMPEPQIHALVTGMDGDQDGLISIEEWTAGFPTMPETHPSTQEAMASLTLKRLPVRELHEGAAVARKPSQPIPAATLAKFKLKLKAPKSYTLIWSNKNTCAPPPKIPQRRPPQIPQRRRLRPTQRHRLRPTQRRRP